jgi:hypothetical protein
MSVIKRPGAVAGDSTITARSIAKAAQLFALQLSLCSLSGDERDAAIRQREELLRGMTKAEKLDARVTARAVTKLTAEPAEAGPVDRALARINGNAVAA